MEMGMGWRVRGSDESLFGICGVGWKLSLTELAYVYNGFHEFILSQKDFSIRL
jgi:hypothetical protein